MLRVDVPEGESFRTVFYGPSAIFALHVTDEVTARTVASRLSARPAYAYIVEQSMGRLAAPQRDDDEFDDDEPL